MQMMDLQKPTVYLEGATMDSGGMAIYDEKHKNSGDCICSECLRKKEVSGRFKGFVFAVIFLFVMLLIVVLTHNL